VDTFSAIKSRRSVKHYDPKHRMSDDEINQLLSLAILSPTAYNIQNWRFVIARNPSLRSEIRLAAGNQAQVTDASLLIVLCADLKAWEKQPQRYLRNAPQATQDFVLPMIDQYYRGKEQVQRDEAMRSCGFAAQTLMLAAKSMGYDSVPMNGFNFEKVAALIQLPDDHVISMIIAIGKAATKAWPRSGQLPIDEVVINDFFCCA